ESGLVISNGYDEADFAGLAGPGDGGPQKGPVRLVHSGALHSEERDPRSFLRALAHLKRDGILNTGALIVQLRGPGLESHVTGARRPALIAGSEPTGGLFTGEPNTTAQPVLR